MVTGVFGPIPAGGVEKRDAAAEFLGLANIAADLGDRLTRMS